MCIHDNNNDRGMFVSKAIGYYGKLWKRALRFFKNENQINLI